MRKQLLCLFIFLLTFQNAFSVCFARTHIGSLRNRKRIHRYWVAIAAGRQWSVSKDSVRRQQQQERLRQVF